MTASLFTYENLHRAWLDCRRKKRCRAAALEFEVNAEENLAALTRELTERTYHPAPSFCFVARNDKHREVFAAHFRDRVVHHLLVRRLEAIWEPVFIHDSYACRKGKGTHAAVQRLQQFMRKVTTNGVRRAWCAQLDIRAFFPSIDRQKLLDMVLSRLDEEELRWLAELLILHDPTIDPVFTCSAAKWRNVPAHKSLFTVPHGKGLPIGNLTSQFFANVYLTPLDQFVKHTLKCRYYIRYVDDLLLLSDDIEWLHECRERIATFLEDRLGLSLHPRRNHILPVSNGVDFVGYVVRSTHMLVRRRVVNNCVRALARRERAMVIHMPQGTWIKAPQRECDELLATLSSYLGMFSHSRSGSLVESLWRRFEVLRWLFNVRGGCAVPRLSSRERPGNLVTQYRFFRTRFRGLVLFQVGCFLELYDRDATWAHRHAGLNRVTPRRGMYARAGIYAAYWRRWAKHFIDVPFIIVSQRATVRGNLRDRGIAAIWLPARMG